MSSTKKQLRKKIEGFDEAIAKARTACDENPSAENESAVLSLIHDREYYAGKLADWEIDRNRIQS